MNTDTLQNKKPTASANYQAGHTLTRSVAPEGAVVYHAGRWGLSLALPDLMAAHLQAQIGCAA